MKCYLGVLTVCLLFIGCDNMATTEPTDRDNPAVNERDASGASVTPTDQSDESRDIEQVAAMRQAIQEIDDLSINGRNVKIVRGEERVTIRGLVDSEGEKDAIAEVVTEYAIGLTVVNELEVESD